MNVPRPLLAPSLLLPLILAAVSTANAQGLGDRIRGRVQRDAERRIEERAVQAARRTLDLAEDAIVCAVTDEECIADARKRGKEPVIVNQDGEPISGYDPHRASGGAPGEGVWAGYDFIPGDRVLFYHDFEGTRVGNFPSRVDYIQGNMEVVELGENRVLRVGGESGGYGCIEIPLGEAFPARYTIELRVRTSDPQARSAWYLFSGEQQAVGCRYAPKPHAVLTGYQGAGIVWSGGESLSPTTKDLVVNEWADIRISVDGPYWKVYVNERRVANVPRVHVPAGASFGLMFGSYREDTYVDDIRIAEGGPRSLYDDLQSQGFISTTAIRFASGSAELRPESTGILTDILEMLEEHSDLKLLIEGHTDSEGSDRSNMTLSTQRAEAVKRWFIDQDVAAGRLDTVGRGEAEPVAGNGTPEGMAQNRRVVFRRQ